MYIREEHNRTKGYAAIVSILIYFTELKQLGKNPRADGRKKKGKTCELPQEGSLVAGRDGFPRQEVLLQENATERAKLGYDTE